MPTTAKMLENSFQAILKQGFEEYSNGEWLALLDDKVIAHGFSLKQVAAEAEKTASRSKVLFSKIRHKAHYL